MCKLKEPAMGNIPKLCFNWKLQLSSQELHPRCSLKVKPSSAVTPYSVKLRCCLNPRAFDLTPALYSCTKKKSLIRDLCFQGLKSLFQRRQTSLIFCRAEQGFTLNTTLASCFPVVSIQEHSCCKCSASIFYAMFRIRIKINSNSEVGWESTLIWQPSWEANQEKIQATLRRQIHTCHLNGILTPKQVTPPKVMT